jgi:hypothetical protein
MECWLAGKMVYLGRDPEKARRALQLDRLAWDTLLISRGGFLEDAR